ncbi:hypothetical protein [Leptospira vanthielii]|uniref:Uncharacterized protein n=1 Tax=Leptospira vanthielii serovar Holland str. Waz Holland = ATCC 700522 TaxID=1218591 RepID=N1W5R4_9LEPT|nr:hypothetical protein [Leptospira vanthielii]EMY68572.1 hypothetical protein LEP1GSC199_1345 [Leptospira vanthielii serovar Holland str. Waz Holland = ATCC 700522]
MINGFKSYFRKRNKFYATYNEASRRGVSQGELIRLALKNEIIQKSELLRRQALMALTELLD